MACFLVPAAEAIAVSLVKKKMKKKELLIQQQQLDGIEVAPVRLQNSEIPKEQGNRIPWSRKLKWLSNLLWGGVFLLGVEHIWHGEVVPWPPFLTAMTNAADTIEMLQEMALVGTVMCAVVTGVWLFMIWFAERKANGLTKQTRPHRSKTRKAVI